MALRKRPPATDYGLELLLDYNGRQETLPGGYFLKFEIKRTSASDSRPHGLRYSFTLHDSDSMRILGFDNAHSVKPLGGRGKKPPQHDHWHRTHEDDGRPYQFIDAASLLDDFYREAEMVLRERGIKLDIIGEQNANQE
ncbi:MAG: DUF6516 family protein [Gemmatimonadota bacterium]|nr:DUF6516 family protein [Gemmatimonadota bacterium]